MGEERGPTPIRKSLERLLAGMGSPEIDSVATLMDRWPEVGGDRLSERIRTGAVRGSERRVSVDDPAWASQISWLEAQLLERIAGIVGPDRITAVRVRVEPRREA